MVYNFIGIFEGKWGGECYFLSLGFFFDGLDWKFIFILESELGEYLYFVIINGLDNILYICYIWK